MIHFFKFLIKKKSGEVKVCFDARLKLVRFWTAL